MRNKSKVIKIIKFILVIILILNIYSANCLAGEFSNIISQGNDFLVDGKNDAVINNAKLKVTSNTIFNILLLLGTFLSVIVGAIIGIKYMMASAGDKAKIKESMIPYILGCIVIFGAAGIWKICISIFEQL